MTNSVPLAQIEHAIRQLPAEERLWLIERLAFGLRQRSKTGRQPFDAALAEMAADPELRRELSQIEQEFAAAESDGSEPEPPLFCPYRA